MSRKRINKNIITKCEIDGKEFKTMRQFLYYLKALSISEKEYFDKFLKNNTDGVCATCGNHTKFENIKYGYQTFCSHKCSVNNIDVAKKRKENTKQALLKKYGVENASQIEGHGDRCKSTCLEKYGNKTYNNPEKATQTCLEKYGRKRATGTESYNKKYKKTVSERYGVEHHTQSEVIKEKIKATNLEKYGVEYTLQSDEIRRKIEETVNELYGGFTFKSTVLTNKVRNTMIKTHGAEHPQQCVEIQNKTKQTNLERYGCENPHQNEDVKEKAKQTNIKKYGFENSFQSPTTKKTLKERYGVENSSQIDGHADKIKKTCLDKFGNEKFFDSEYFKETSKQTSLERYGVEYPMQNKKIYDKMMKSYNLQKHITKFGNEVTYQSNTELDFIKLCESNDIEIFDGDVIDYEWDDKHKKYFSDFKIKINNKFKLIEIKDKHPWYHRDLASGKLQAKCDAGIKYSLDNGYSKFELLFPDRFKEVGAWK